MFGLNFGSKPVQIPGSVQDIVVGQDVKDLMRETNARVIDTRAIVVVVLNANGNITTRYAGVVGDVGACGLLDYGKRIIQDGKIR